MGTMMFFRSLPQFHYFSFTHRNNACLRFPVLAYANANANVNSNVNANANSNLNANSNGNSNVNANANVEWKEKKSGAIASLQLLEWPRLCSLVAEFASTPSSKDILKAFEPPSTMQESEELISLTGAAIEALNFMGGALDFSGLRTNLVQSCMDRLERGFVVTGQEAAAIATLVQFSYSLEQDVKKFSLENKDMINLAKPIFDLVITEIAHGNVFKPIWKVVDADGVIKDSASSALAKARAQERTIEQQLMEFLRMLIRQKGESSSFTQGISSIDGRLCVMITSDGTKKFPGLLLQSGIDSNVSFIEPIEVISLNDKLAQARANVLKEEYEVLRDLTSKLREYVEDIKIVLDTIIQIDIATARAKYSISHNCVRPYLTNTSKPDPNDTKGGHSYPFLSEEILLLLDNLYHPLLLQQYNEEKKKLRRKSKLPHDSSLMKATRPVSIDVHVKRCTRVVTITGPNTGGKTAAIKAVGLAALMAKSGLYVPASEPVLIPWFDGVFADIGDEQSLSQSLSTFSGHIFRINRIQAESTAQSLVLLDEVGTGTNPVEGAALGMSLLESFAGSSLLTIATTHHGELKILKYRDDRFENVSVEFNEELVRPTYKLIWGVPGRSNALNISEKLGVPESIIIAARQLHGEASAQINKVIVDLEKAKQDLNNQLNEANECVTKAKKIRSDLVESSKSLNEHRILVRRRGSYRVDEVAHKARSTLMAIYRKKQTGSIPKGEEPPRTQQDTTLHKENRVQEIPKVGANLYVPRLGKQVKVLKVLNKKGDILVECGTLQVQLKVGDFN